MVPLEYKQFDCTLKLSDAGEFEGYAAVFGNIDRVGDRIEQGAFTNLEYLLEKGALLWQHDAREVVGLLTRVQQDDYGLKVAGRFHTTPRAQEVRTIIKERTEAGKPTPMSIGYMPVQWEWETASNGQVVRVLKRVEVYEVSFVAVPANPLAQGEAKKVVPLQDLPLAPRDRRWDADAAVKRVRRWAGGPDKETIDWRKYRKAFFWYDADNPEKFESYKLPYADVIDGELHAVPRGIFAVAAVLQGARGGVDIPERDIERIKRVVSAWYARMREAFKDESIVPPWERGKQAEVAIAALRLTLLVR